MGSVSGDCVLRGGRVIDPARSIDGFLDVWVRNGRVEAIGPQLQVPGIHVFDVSGCVVCPGLIDMHVHLREPGFEHKETIATGSAAAARGGFTSIVCMANTHPPIDRPETLQQVQDIIRETARVNVYPMASLTWEHGQERLSDLASLTGAVAFTDDAFPVQSAALMREGMREAARLDRVVATHCEDWSLCKGGAINEGALCCRLRLKGMPAVGEDIAIARNVLLADSAGCRVHICHVSTARGVDLIRWAKERGLSVTAEACPHHFTLTEEAVLARGANAKMSPPLRQQRDVEAVRAGLKEGVLDAIATDHAPHARHEKEEGLEAAPYGIVGLETALGLVMSQLVEPGVLSLPEAVRRMTAEPARILNLPLGSLEPGAPADITVFDPDAQWRVEPEQFASQSRNTPFAGSPLRGRNRLTLVAGQAAYVDEEWEQARPRS